MLTKEECLKALESFKPMNIDEYFKGNYPSYIEANAILKQLIEEHFYIQPIITAFKVYSDSTFQSFTKKELIEYIHTIYHNWKNACIVNERVIKMNYKLQSEIDELKSNPPLKFEELETEKWYWDNKSKEYFEIYDIDDEEKVLIVYDYYAKDFEENRFYRKEVDV